MGLLAAILGQQAEPTIHSHPAASSRPSWLDAAMARARRRQQRIDEVEAAVGPTSVPGPPPVPRWNSATSPLPDTSLVEAGMRPITGGRRGSF